MQPQYNPQIYNVMNDPNKIKRKIPVPTNTGMFNFTGLIIGPKG